MGFLEDFFLTFWVIFGGFSDTFSKVFNTVLEDFGDTSRIFQDFFLDGIFLDRISFRLVFFSIQYGCAV